MKPRKVKGAKKVSYELIDPKSVVGQPIYKLLRELVKTQHTHLLDARIAIAWCTSWKPDVDGRCILGKCVKASDLHRELAPYDFVILLKKSFWQDLHVTSEQRAALLDHELCHAGVRCDERTGDPIIDERGRKAYRLVKHDVEEFNAIVQRHGIWKRDIEAFFAALNRAARSGFEPCDECRDTSHPGWIVTTEGLMRCACWKTWQERYAEAVPA